MVDYDFEADRISNEIQLWMMRHHGQRLTEPDVVSLEHMVAEFHKAAARARGSLSNADARADVFLQGARATLDRGIPLNPPRHY